MIDPKILYSRLRQHVSLAQREVKAPVLSPVRTH